MQETTPNHVYRRGPGGYGPVPDGRELWQVGRQTFDEIFAEDPRLLVEILWIASNIVEDVTQSDPVFQYDDEANGNRIMDGLLTVSNHLRVMARKYDRRAGLPEPENPIWPNGEEEQEETGNATEEN